MKLKPAVAELLATFCFIFIGVGSVVAASMPGYNMGPLGPAFAHGLALAVLITATMHISGGQLNPAVTIGVWLGNKITLGQAVANIIGQLAGALMAVTVLAQCLGEDRLLSENWGLPVLGPGIGTYEGMAIEAIVTFVLVFAVFGTAVDRRAPKVGGLYIGLVVVIGAIAVAPFTGACFNPARYFGPALMSANWTEMIVYTAGPILGGAIAALVYTYGIGSEDRTTVAEEAASH